MDKYLVSKDTRGVAFPDEASLTRDALSDPNVFKQLYLVHIRPIYRYVYSKVGNTEQAEDITAQVFLEALESLPHYRHDGHFTAWLFSIARHKVADYYRTAHNELSLDAGRITPDKKSDSLSALIQTEEIQEISKLILQLDEQDRELLRLRLVAELSFGEIAKLMQKNMEATKKRFYRLLANLRQQLELEHE